MFSQLFHKILKLFGITILLAGVVTYQSCDIDKFEPLGENSIADATPPNADFSFTQGAGSADEWKDYTFANTSTSATTYAWDFGDGNTSTEVDPINTYPGEGTYTVTLTASDALGVTSTVSQTITVVEPAAPTVIIPVIKESSFEESLLTKAESLVELFLSFCSEKSSSFTHNAPAQLEAAAAARVQFQESRAVQALPLFQRFWGYNKSEAGNS